MPRPSVLLLLPTVALAISACGQDYEVNAQKRVLSTAQATFDAGMVAVNDRETLDVLLYSTGRGAVTIFDIQVEDNEHWSVSPGWQAFDEDDDPETLVLQGGSDEDPDSALFEVVFRPGAELQYRTVLTIISNDSEVTERTEDDNGIWKIVLRGIGRVPCGNVYPLFHDFGPRAPGGYFSRQARVENCGGVTLTVADFNPVGSTSFSVESVTPMLVLPGDSDTIELAFQPAGGAPAASADIEIVSNDPDLALSTIAVLGNDCSQSILPQWDNDNDGWLACAGDCDDNDASVNPSMPERPDNGKDDDCDGVENEPAGLNIDDDGDGYTENDGDCHDGDPEIYPGAPERQNQMDDDCDGRIDEGTTWYDDDGDGLSEREGDCDDANNLVYPGAPESQNEIDDDCDGQVDEGFYTFDDDFDGFADVEPDGQNDCNDEDPWTYPGAAEDCDNRDNDCDGEIDEGEDGSPNGACAFLVERVVATEAPKGCSSLPADSAGGAGGLGLLAGLAGLVGLLAAAAAAEPRSRGAAADGAAPQRSEDRNR